MSGITKVNDNSSTNTTGTTIKLTIRNFCTDYAFRCFSKDLSKEDQRRAVISMIVLSILSLGTFTIAIGLVQLAVLALRKYRNYSQKSLTSNNQKKENEKKEETSNSKSNIKPDNIKPDLKYEKESDMKQEKVKKKNKIYEMPREKLLGPKKLLIGDNSEENLKNYREGLSKETADKIEKYLEDNNIPLQLFPKRPDKSYSLDNIKLEAFKNTLIDENGNKDNDQIEVLQKMVDNVQHISMEKFDEALKECTEELNKSLKDKKFSVGLCCGKSGQWVTGLALKTLETLPTSWFPLESSIQGTVSKGVIESKLGADEVEEENIVLYEDLIYSGEQLETNIRSIKYAIDKKTVKNLFVVVPFATQQAIDKIEKQKKLYKDKLNITIITSKQGKIKTAGEIFENYKTTSSGKKIRSKAREFFHNDAFKSGAQPAEVEKAFEATLCYTDWKIPDAQSFMQGFGSTHMKPQDNREPDKNYYCKILKEEEYFIPEKVPNIYAINPN